MNVREIEDWEDETEYDEHVVIYLSAAFLFLATSSFCRQPTAKPPPARGSSVSSPTPALPSDRGGAVSR